MAQDDPTHELDAHETSANADPAEQRSPSIVKRKPVNHPHKNHQIGNIVYDKARAWNAYLSPRTVETNLFNKHNAFPISTKLLGPLQYYEVERVLIPVRDDIKYGHGTVYEFDLTAYLPENSPVYEWDRGDYVDEQVCPDKDEDSRHVWVELGSDLFYHATK